MLGLIDSIVLTKNIFFCQNEVIMTRLVVCYSSCYKVDEVRDTTKNAAVDHLLREEGVKTGKDLCAFCSFTCPKVL